MVGMGALAWLVGVVTGCTTVVVAPREVSDPVDVLLIDHGRTPSLVIPLDDDQQQLVRYAYGEYRYYAQARRHPPGVVRALFWPTEAALGRRVLPGPMDLAHVQQQLAVPTQEAFVLRVERRAVQQLRDELDALYRRNDATPLHNPVADLAFVPHPNAYMLLSNSNHTISGWLKALGCEVRRQSVISRWRVDQPAMLADPPIESVVGQHEGDV